MYTLDPPWVPGKDLRASQHAPCRRTNHGAGRAPNRRPDPPLPEVKKTASAWQNDLLEGAMSETHPAFKVDQIDHVEFFVPDRREAARWYERTLGLAPVPQHEDWAADPGGPLLISSNVPSQRGGPTPAPFTGEPPRDR